MAGFVEVGAVCNEAPRRLRRVTFVVHLATVRLRSVGARRCEVRVEAPVLLPPLQLAHQHGAARAAEVGRAKVSDEAAEHARAAGLDVLAERRAFLRTRLHAQPALRDPARVHPPLRGRERERAPA